MSTERRKVILKIKEVLPILDSPSVEFLCDEIIKVFNKTRPLSGEWNMVVGGDPDYKPDEAELLVQKLESELRFNFPRGVKDQQLYKRLIASGKPIEDFISWVKSDEKRLSFAFLYAKDTGTIWRDWPQAFPNQLTEERPSSFYG